MVHACCGVACHLSRERQVFPRDVLNVRLLVFVQVLIIFLEVLLSLLLLVVTSPTYILPYVFLMMASIYAGEVATDPFG